MSASVHSGELKNPKTDMTHAEMKEFGAIISRSSRTGRICESAK